MHFSLIFLLWLFTEIWRTWTIKSNCFYMLWMWPPRNFNIPLKLTEGVFDFKKLFLFCRVIVLNYIITLFCTNSDMLVVYWSIFDKYIVDKFIIQLFHCLQILVYFFFSFNQFHFVILTHSTSLQVVKFIYYSVKNHYISRNIYRSKYM